MSVLQGLYMKVALAGEAGEDAHTPDNALPIMHADFYQDMDEATEQPTNNPLTTH